MIVVVTAAAKSDLLDISDYIARDNPERAASFTEELLECCESLSDQHSIFAFVPRYEKMRIQMRTYKRYLIFYRVHQGRVEIIHILHGARDVDALLSGAFDNE
jgi:toxin ParE1/3/4